MTSRTRFASAVAAVALIALASPAAAQEATAGQSPRVVATYDFGAGRHHITFPSVVTITDSAGTLIASAKVADGRTALPMLVHVIESDLVLEALTPDGILTLVLEKQAQGEPAPTVAGRWSVGTNEGLLRARTRT